MSITVTLKENIQEHDFSACGTSSEGCAGRCSEEKHTVHVQPGITYTDQAYWQALSVLVSELPWAPKTLLDMGCGNATQLAWLAGANPWVQSIQAVETEEGLYQQAITQHPCRVRYQQVQNLSPLPFKAGQFEMVTSHGFLNQHPNPSFYIDEACRISSGSIVLSFYAPLALKFAKFMPKLKLWQLNGRQVKTSCQVIGLEQVKSQLQNKGFQVQNVYHPWPFILLSALK